MISWEPIGRARVLIALIALILPFGLTASLASGCGTETTVNLGAQGPRPYHFGTPRQLVELSTTSSSDNPTLTGDLLEIYFTSARDGISNDVWSARRASPTNPFSEVAPVIAANTPSFETSSAISLDGLTLWVGSDRPGGLGGIDVWMLSRPTRDAPWSEPVDLLLMNSPMNDVPRPPGQHGLFMPLASQRDNPDLYRTYLSPRTSLTAPFTPPRVVSELVFATQSTVDAFLSDDGLTLFFSSSPPMGAGDLFIASRRSTSETFSTYQPINELNTAADERDPWLSPDGRTLFFSSNRDGVLTIYEAAASRS